MRDLDKDIHLKLAYDGAGALNVLSHDIHKVNQHFYHDLVTGEKVKRNLPELMMLIVSEIAEAMEGVRKDLMDDKLPTRKAEEVEMADALIRLLDYCGYRNLDITGAVREKMAFNATRLDHTDEARRAAHGKKF